MCPLSILMIAQHSPPVVQAYMRHIQQAAERKMRAALARSREIEQRVRASTAEFRALEITQRPAFLIDTQIGDRAVFSGVVKLEPLTTTLDSMLEDAAVYAAHRAHFGDPPAK